MSGDSSESRVAPSIELVSIESAADPLMPLFRQLVRDFLKELNEDLDYQGVEHELAALPGKYSRSQRGCMYIAVDRSSPLVAAVGCIGLRQLETDRGEVKRMFVQPQYRGHRVAERLLQRIVHDAITLGYSALRLDTLARLQAANRLYTRMGFHRIPPYNDCPIEGAMWFELELTAKVYTAADSSNHVDDTSKH